MLLTWQIKAWILKSHREHGIIKADGTHDIPKSVYKSDSDSGSETAIESESDPDSWEDDDEPLAQKAARAATEKQKSNPRACGKPPVVSRKRRQDQPVKQIEKKQAVGKTRTSARHLKQVDYAEHASDKSGDDSD